MDDRILGAMYGLALGDALGATTEFLSRSEVRRRYPQGHREIIGGGAFRWAPGQVTDDTDMALCVMRGLRDAGLEAPLSKIVDSVGAEFMKWRARNPPDIGNIVRLALDTFARVGDWKIVARAVQADRGEYAAGNGALMRTLPISLFWPQDIERVKAVSLALTHMTHPHPEAEWCSMAYNVFVCGLLDGHSAKASWAKAVAAVPLEGTGLQKLAWRFADIPNELLRMDENVIRSSGYCVDTLEAALFCFFTTESAEDCIVKAANLGDDADTVAAVAGGIAGAHYGRGALPSRWMEKLEEKVRVEIASTWAR